MDRVTACEVWEGGRRAGSQLVRCGKEGEGPGRDRIEIREGRVLVWK